jgi:AbrB family transcriptional regulator, transcriptional pleiotropic regulator of transition state genes
LKTTGIARKVDQLGRVVLPAEMRRMFGINEGDLIEIFVDSGRIVLAKVEDECVFCGTKDALREFELKRVCITCVDRLHEVGD